MGRAVRTPVWFYCKMTDEVHFLNEIAAHIRARNTETGNRAGRLSEDNFPLSVKLVRGVETGEMLVGQLPPQPPTLRGRIGKALVGLVQRCLFWYTPAIHEFQRALASALSEQSEALSVTRATLSERLAALQRENVELREQLRDEMKAWRQLDDLSNRVSTLETEIARHNSLISRLDKKHSELQVETLLRKDDLLEVAGDLSSRIHEQAEKQLLLAEQVRLFQEQLTDAIGKFQVVDQFTLSTRAEVMLMERRVSTQLSGASQPPESRAPTRPPPAPLTDPQYYDFENLFRGSEQEIRERVAIYIPRFKEARIGVAEMPIIDVGCGRGEWLDVLRDNRLLAYGVDGNSLMIAKCREKGLVVEEQDGLEHLRSLPAASVGAITAFHFIEHLPFEVLLSFIDEVLRVLKPNGLVLLETPNPDNLSVGANTFYLDPTHQRPIPNALLKFLMQSRGFSAIEVLPLHPYSSEYFLPTDGNSVAELVNERLFGCQDYGLIARKV